MDSPRIDAQQPSEPAGDADMRSRVLARLSRLESDYELHELLTVEEVAALLKVTRSWVYEHTRARGVAAGERLPHIKIGKYVRFDARAVGAFLERKGRPR
jgi:excisionase family DNA binding protein